MVRLSNPQETRVNLALAGHEQQIKWLKRYLKLRGIDPNPTCMCLIGYIGSARQARVAKGEAATIIRRFKGVSAGKRIGDAWKKNRFRSAYLRNTLWDLGYAVDTLETAVNWDKVTDTMVRIENGLEQALQAGADRVLLDNFGIQALRGGDVPGEHTVMFIGSGERLELTHRSAARAHFRSVQAKPRETPWSTSQAL